MDTVVIALSNRCSREQAAAAAEATPRTLQRWLARGARAHFGTAHTEYDEELCAQLYEGVKEVGAAAKEGNKPVIGGARLIKLSTVPTELLGEKSAGYASGSIVLAECGPVVENRTDWGLTACGRVLQGVLDPRP
ncbi:hypothetical protein [Streptomyces sp. NPDC094149]|uniref:hypothetical protein n=1 Tax=Streptomyces sp. NPDC094149 TaxID=3155079 RepID=UPI0033209345